jgi:hypothetical protein
MGFVCVKRKKPNGAHVHLLSTAVKGLQIAIRLSNAKSHASILFNKSLKKKKRDRFQNLLKSLPE